MANVNIIKAGYRQGATDEDGRQKNFNAVEAAVWEALEPYLEKEIDLDLNETREMVSFCQMVAAVTQKVMEVVE